MTQNILIPTDFSTNSWNSIRYTLELYKNTPCRIYLLHVYNLKFTNRGELRQGIKSSFRMDSEKQKSIEGLEKTIEKMKKYSLNEYHHFYTVSVMDDIISGMQSVVEKENITLVVMGTKGATNFEKKAFGSNAINAMENLTNCPILAIPVDSEAKDFKEIVFPTDYKMNHQKSELTYLIEIAQLTKSNICFLTVSNERGLLPDQKENKSNLINLLSSVDHSFHTVRGNDPNEVVRIFAESRGSNIVCFMNRKHTLLSRLFHKPMSEELGMFSEIPLLVLPVKK